MSRSIYYLLLLLLARLFAIYTITTTSITTSDISNNYADSKTMTRLDLFIEVLLVTDYSIFEMHKNIIKSSKWNSTLVNDELVENHIKAYYTQIIDDVNNRYKRSFEDDDNDYYDDDEKSNKNDSQKLSIKIIIADFFISKDPMESPWSELSYTTTTTSSNRKEETRKIEILNGDLALVYFNEWIENNRNTFAEFDHAFGITAHDLYSQDKRTDYNGLAFVYGICRSSFSGSLIEERGGFSSSRSFAHELAHNLGARHDGIEESQCSSWDNFLMSPIFLPYNQRNSWMFSKCSKNMMKSFLTNSDNNFCLLNKPKSRTTRNGFTSLPEEESNLYPGQVYDSADQCRQLHGQASTPCLQYQNSFCESLYCARSSQEPECIWIAPAAEGTECGTQKWCIQGKCEQKAINTIGGEQLEMKKNVECADSVMWLGELNLDEQNILNIKFTDSLISKKFNFTCEFGIKLLMKATNKSFEQVCNEWMEVCCKTCKN